MVRNKFKFGSIFFLILILPISYYYLLSKNQSQRQPKLQPKKSIELRNTKYWIIRNAIIANKVFEYDESITLTTLCDYTFLDNIRPLVNRWNGPISLAVYAPGDDFYKSLDYIVYLRNCIDSDIIKDFVTFHFVFDAGHIPDKIAPLISYTYTDTHKCSKSLPSTDRNLTYRYNNHLLYPINLLRNVARETATTRYVFPSDIELYPNRYVIDKFLKFIKNRENEANIKEVFVLPVFEIESNETVPETKEELVKMYRRNRAISFHKYLCNYCHEIPDLDKWLNTTPSNNDITIFTTIKRYGGRRLWEPFYISNNREPPFHENFTWEGMNNKNYQNFEMCLLGYDYNVLDNVFLVHKPGIKKSSIQQQETKNEVLKTNSLIQQLRIDSQIVYGFNNKCGV